MKVLVASEILSITVRDALARSTLSHYYYYYYLEWGEILSLGVAVTNGPRYYMV